MSSIKVQKRVVPLQPSKSRIRVTHPSHTKECDKGAEDICPVHPSVLANKSPFRSLSLSVSLSLCLSLARLSTTTWPAAARHQKTASS